MQRQKDLIELQDTLLGDISEGINRIHNQALTMSDETKASMRLLDDVDRDIESTTNALQVMHINLSVTPTYTDYVCTYIFCIDGSAARQSGSGEDQTMSLVCCDRYRASCVYSTVSVIALLMMYT